MPSLAKSSLRIAIVGAGRIGSALAFNLKRIGSHEVTVIARPGSQRLQQLQRDNGIVNLQQERADVSVADYLSEDIPYDLLIVTVLGHQVDAVLPALKASRASRILFLFNNFEPERLRDLIGAERCSFGMPFLQADFDSSGRLKATIGVGGSKSLLGDEHLVSLFQESGIAAKYEANMMLWLRCHVPLGASMESVSATAVQRGGGAPWTLCMTLSSGVHECYKLIQAQGYEIYPSDKARINSFPIWVLASVLWFFSRIKSFRELLATGASECCALVDAMAAAASKTNSSISVKAIQAMKPKQS